MFSFLESASFYREIDWLWSIVTISVCTSLSESLWFLWQTVLGIISLSLLILGHLIITRKEAVDKKELILVFPGIGIQNGSVFLPVEVIKDVVIVEHIPNLWDIRFLLIAICRRPKNDCATQHDRSTSSKISDVRSGNDVILKSGDAMTRNDVIVPLLSSGKTVKLESLKQAYQMIHQSFNFNI